MTATCSTYRSRMNELRKGPVIKASHPGTNVGNGQRLQASVNWRYYYSSLLPQWWWDLGEGGGEGGEAKAVKGERGSCTESKVSG